MRLLLCDFKGKAVVPDMLLHLCLSTLCALPIVGFIFAIGCLLVHCGLDEAYYDSAYLCIALPLSVFLFLIPLEITNISLLKSLLPIYLLQVLILFASNRLSGALAEWSMLCFFAETIAYCMIRILYLDSDIQRFLSPLFRKKVRVIYWLSYIGTILSVTISLFYSSGDTPYSKNPHPPHDIRKGSF